MSFTTDMWTSKSRKPFIGVTGHWIDPEWKLQSCVLGFKEAPGRHQGTNICEAFVSIIDEYGLFEKVNPSRSHVCVDSHSHCLFNIFQIGWVTGDNASNNMTFLRELESVGNIRGINLPADAVYIRCLAHIVNLVSRSCLETIQQDVDSVR